MTEPRSVAASGLHRRALVDLDAFAANLAGLDSPFLDARADAYGHSLELVGPVARDLGIAGVIVSDDTDASVARRLGFGDILAGRAQQAVASTDASAYGLSPGSRPVLSLEGEVVAVKRVPGGSGVSYGYTYRTAAPTHLALIGLGYSDGVPRLASNHARVMVGGRQHPLVGRIAMDQLVVDCGDEAPRPGDIAVLFGDPGRGEPSAAEWAEWTERAPLDLTAGLGLRIVREPR